MVRIGKLETAAALLSALCLAGTLSAQVDSQRSAEDRAQVSGQVRTADGQPLPERIDVLLVSRRPRSSALYSAKVRDGRFSSRVAFGRVYVTVYAEGYAAVVLPAQNAEPGGAVDLDIVLERGFSATLRVVDLGGRPIPRADITAEYLPPDSRAISVRYESRPRPLLTDADGRVTLDHLNGMPLRLSVTAPGFPYARKEVQPTEGKEVRWRLQPGRPTTGTVLAKADGRPIAGARFRFLASELRSDPRNFWYRLEQAPLMAETDEEGRFLIDELQDHAPYDLLLEADGFERRILGEIRAGQEDLRLELGPPISVTGILRGALERLGHDAEGRPRLRYHRDQNTARSGYTVDNEVPVEIADGVGRFHIEDLWAGKIVLEVPGNPLELDVSESVAGLDIAVPVEVVQRQRTVVYRFQIPEGSPPATGTLRTDYLVGTAGERHYELQWLPIENGQARTVVPVPTQVRYEVGRTEGYWFSTTHGIEVPDSDGEHVVSIPVIPAGNIRGTIQAQAGARQRRVSVSVSTVGKSPRLGADQHPIFQPIPTKLDGSFTFGPLPLDGRYRIVASSEYTWAIGDQVTLTEETPTATSDILLPTGRAVRGQVTDRDGRPLAGIEVTLALRREDIGSFSRSPGFVTDARGLFEFPGVNPEAGTYVLGASKNPGFRPSLLDIDEFDQVQQIRLVEGLVITGQVVDADGKPVPGVRVYTFESEPFFFLEAEGNTDEEGRFRFSNLQEMEYRLMIAAPGLSTQDVLASPGPFLRIVLRAPRGGY